MDHAGKFGEFVINRLHCCGIKITGGVVRACLYSLLALERIHGEINRMVGLDDGDKARRNAAEESASVSNMMGPGGIEITVTYQCSLF